MEWLSAFGGDPREWEDGIPERATRGTDSPRLLLVGEDGRRLGAIERTLEPLRLRPRRRADLREVLAEDLDGTAGAVLAPPLRGAPCERAVAQLRRRHRGLPVFVVAPQDEPDDRVGRLYRRGATAVFAWPLERGLLPGVMGELLGVEPRPSLPSDADRSLERAIRARLGVLGRAEKELRIAVRNGVALLAGRVDKLWKVRFLDNDIAHVPGVRATDARKLEVKPSGLPDRDIARSLRILLRGVSSIEDRTLSVSVHAGHAVLMGTVINREEWLHALELITMVDGVRSVTNRTVEAPRRKRSDRALAKRLQERLSMLVPASEGIRVAVLGEVAVLRGKTPLLATRREAETIIARDASIARIVNKIEVSSADRVRGRS